jgi:hypothetical protein
MLPRLSSALLGLLGSLSLSSAAVAQGAPPLPSMPRPPSFEDPAPAAKPRKAKRSQASTAASEDSSKAGVSFDRPNKFVPAEFDRERRGGTGAGAAPMVSGSGRAGMGMRF